MSISLIHRYAIPPIGVAFAGVCVAVADCQDHWLPAMPGPNGTVYDMQVADIGEGHSLYFSGAFGGVAGIEARRVARWDGSQWHALGAGVWDLFFDQVYALKPYKGELIVGGLFSQAGGVNATNVARWNGTSWAAMGDGLDGGVWDFVVHDGDLYASGHFTNAGGEPANRVARWDGTQWHALGSGMNGPVFTLGLYNGDVIAGGDFTEADGQPANHIARWDGEQWQPIGDGVNAWVRAFLVHDGKLIVGGQFDEAAGQSANYVAQWDDATETWSPLGDGITGGFIPPGVEALAFHNGNIVAGGNFTEAEGQPASRIARWDGNAWHPLGEGASSTVWALEPYDNLLHAGGFFTEADGETVPHWARWDISGNPVIETQPVDVSANKGDTVQLAVTATGDGLTYQWRRDGLPLVDGGNIDGANTETLTLTALAERDAGMYDVLVSNTCGTAISNSVQVDLDAVLGDLNGDGVVDVSDLLILLGQWGDCPADCPADLNGDGVIDVSDLLILLGNWG